MLIEGMRITILHSLSYTPFRLNWDALMLDLTYRPE